MNNPYAPPASDVNERKPSNHSASKLLVDCDWLVVRTGAILPERCVICNADTSDSGKRYEKKLSYVSPFIYILLLVNILILLIVYLVIRKPVSISYSICDYHRMKKHKFGWLSLGAAALAVTAFFCGGIYDFAFLFLIGFILVVTALIYLVLAINGLRPRKHDNGEFWIKGCGPAFLDSIRNMKSR